MPATDAVCASPSRAQFTRTQLDGGEPSSRAEEPGPKGAPRVPTQLVLWLSSRLRSEQARISILEGEALRLKENLQVRLTTATDSDGPELP